MGLTVGHVKNVTIADGTDGNLVLPSDWNSNHAVTLSLANNEVIKYISAGTNSVSSGNVQFANSNGVSFGMDTNGVITGTVNTNYQAPGAYLTTAALSNHSHAFATTTTNGASVVVGTSNSNGVTIGVPAYLTTARASNDAIGLNTALTGNGVSVTANSSGLSINVPAFLTTAMQSNASTGYMLTGERNNYFYTSNNTFANSTHSHGNPTLALTNLSGSTASASNGLTISLSAAAPGGAGTTNQTGPNIADGNGVTITSGTVVFSNGNGVSFGLNGSTMTASVNAGGAGYTALTYQNRQLGASTQITNWQNSLWLCPFRVAAPVSASTLQIMQSFSGSISSATTGTYGQTLNLAIYSQHATDPNRFDTMWSTQRTLSVMGSSTNSAGWAYNGGGSSGANTTIVTQQFYGMRLFDFPINSTLGTGLYLFGLLASSSTAQYSAIVSSRGFVFDAPMPLAMGSNFGSAAATSIGYVDAGTWSSATTGAFPATVSIGHIKPVSNFVPYFKIGAI